MSKILENVNCNICDSDDTTVVGHVDIEEDDKNIFRTDRLNVVKCKRCGLAYTNPRPTDETLKTYYEKYYSKLTSVSSEVDIKKNKEMMLCMGGYATYDPRFCAWALRTIYSIGGKKGKLLDIGCGEGKFLLYAREEGWEVFGQEVSEEAANHLKDTYHLDVRVGDLRTLKLQSDYFDSITMINVIEHLSNPLEYLREIHRVLKKGGILYLSTPNEATMRKYRRFTIPEHLYRHSRKPMNALLVKAGFQVVIMTTRDKHDVIVNLEILKENLITGKNGVKGILIPVKRMIETAFGICIGDRGLILPGSTRLMAFARK